MIFRQSKTYTYKEVNETTRTRQKRPTSELSPIFEGTWNTRRNAKIAENEKICASKIVNNGKLRLRGLPHKGR